jgi:hypothetical protein
VIWEGIPEEVMKHIRKQFPTIKGLRSSSEFQDMTPTTPTEKKRSMKLFRKRGEAEDKDTESGDYEAPFDRSARLLRGDVPVGSEVGSGSGSEVRERVPSVPSGPAYPPPPDATTLPEVKPRVSLPELPQ